MQQQPTNINQQLETHRFGSRTTQYYSTTLCIWWICYGLFHPFFCWELATQKSSSRHDRSHKQNPHGAAVPSVTDRPALDPKLSQGHPPGCGDLELTQQKQPTGWPQHFATPKCCCISIECGILKKMSVFYHLQWKIRLKWMIQGYPCFRKPPDGKVALTNDKHRFCLGGPQRLILRRASGVILNKSTLIFQNKSHSARNTFKFLTCAFSACVVDCILSISFSKAFSRSSCTSANICNRTT